MSLPSAVIDAMLESGCTAEQIARAVKAANAEAEARAEHKRAMDAERKRRQRAREKEEMSRDVTRTARDSKDAPLARVEDKPLPTKIEPQDKNSAPASPSPRQQLETVLDSDRADAVIEHRKRIKAPLTARAAKLLAKELGKCPDPNAAADLILLKGWRGFEADWVTKPNQRAGPPKPNPGLDVIDSLMDRLDAVTPSPPQANPPYPRLVAPAGSR